MKIAVYSDLHNEFSEFVPPMLDVELVVLAGDISVRGQGVEWANAAFDCPVIYVPGNHEFYRGALRPNADEDATGGSWACSCSG